MAKKAPMSGQANERAKDRAAGLSPYPDQPIRKPNGERVFHGIGGTPRFAVPLPATSRGPIRSREARAAKGLPGYARPR